MPYTVKAGNTHKYGDSLESRLASLLAGPLDGFEASGTRLKPLRLLHDANDLEVCCAARA